MTKNTLPALIGVTSSILAAALKALAAPGGSAVRTGEDFIDLFIKHGAQPLFTPPAIGEYWPGQGGEYAGQVREDNGTIYHQILAVAKPPSRHNHAAATKWAASLTVDGHSDFVLPTRRGAALLYANLSDRFEKTWHWTSTVYSASYAWYCGFDDGDQYGDYVSSAGAVRAVRRFKA